MRKRMGGMYDLGRGVENMKRQNDPLFQRACGIAGVLVSRRQASKWNNRKGAAFKVRGRARRELKREQLQHNHNGSDRQR